MKIDFLIGDNPYGTTAHFAKGLADALIRQGVDTRLFWIADGYFFQAFYAISADPPDLTCSFSDISLNKRPLGELWQIPHLSLFVDPPIYFLHQLTTKYGWASCVDKHDVDFLTLQLDINCEHVFFLPHAADAKWLTPVDKTRSLDAVFFGTCIDYEKIASNWLGHEQDLLHTAAKTVLSSQGISIAKALIELGVQAYDLPRLHAEVDSYTRGKDRVELLRAMDPSKVKIWGAGPWEKYLPGYTVGAPLDFVQTLQVMQESKIVLNSSPRFKAGAHERVFYALMCGASVYTGANAYLTAQLPDIQTYQFGQWQPPDFNDWQQRAAAGQTQVLSSHTWDARAATLIQDFLIHKTLV